MVKLKDFLNDIISYEFESFICNLSESLIKVGKINMDVLDNTENNYNYTLKAKQFGKLIDDYEKYNIYQFTPKNKTGDFHDVFIYNDLTYVYFNYTLNDGYIEEKKIWQDRLNLGLFREIMFNYYLSKFKGIVSDTVHSPNGEKYWKKILLKAKNIGFKTYVLKNNTEKISIDDLESIDCYFTSSIYKFVIEKST